MAVRAVGLLYPGIMGQGIGGFLHDHGVRVLTCLAGRSQQTRERAQNARLEDTDSLETLVSEVDVILSILSPAGALNVARRVSKAITVTKSLILYVDCNSIKPQAAIEIGRVIVEAGGRVADAGIFGLPPGTTSPPIYASGPDAAEFAELNAYGLDVRIISNEMGQASAMELVCAGAIKGVLAIGIELLIAAQMAGVGAAVAGEFDAYLADITPVLRRYAALIPPRAARWSGEMQETAEFLKDLGLPSTPFSGAGDLYALIAQSSLKSSAAYPTKPDPLAIAAMLAQQISKDVNQS